MESPSPRYHNYVQELNAVLRRYDRLLESLTPVETDLLKKQLAELQRVLGTGFTPLNWNSQRILAFIETCEVRSRPHAKSFPLYASLTIKNVQTNPDIAHINSGEDE